MDKEQPTHEVKRATLRGEKTGWDYRFRPPPVPHDKWTPDDWITYIGDNWFRLPEVPV